MRPALAHNAPLTKGLLARYGAAFAPAAILGLPLSIYLPPYLAETGIATVAALGFYFLLAAIWDGVVDPMIGTMIDRKRAGGVTHWQWMLMGALPLAMLLSVIVFLPKLLPGSVLLLCLLLFYSVFSMYDVAHASWGAGLARTGAESARIFGAREFWSKLTLIVAFGLPAAMQAIDPNVSLFMRLAVYAGFALLTIPLALALSKTLPAAQPVLLGQINWRKELSALKKTPVVITLMSIQILSAIAIGTMASLFVFFADGVLELGKAGSILLFATYFGGAFGVPVWTRLGAKYGKAKVLVWLFLWLALVLSSALILPKANLVMSAIFAVVLGTGFVVPVFLPALMADFAPYDAKACGRDRTAFLFSLVSISHKVGGALAIGISYTLLDWLGFVAAAPKASAEVILGLFTGIPIAALLCAALLAIVLRRYVAKHSTD
jgi:glycoside/pentoside/hexuronide:cation symporter, GPH family